MTFIATESSVFNGEPIEIYEFTRGSETWRYTSADRDVTISGYVWTSRQLQRESLEGGQDLNKSSLRIRSARNLPVAEQFIVAPPSDEIQLTIRRYHESDIDREIVVSWIGRLTNVSFSRDEAEMVCEPILTALNRPGLRRLYQRNCPHVLYGNSCRAVKSSFQTTAPSATISGASVQASEFSSQVDGYFDGGELEFANDRGSTDRRLILSHVGDTLTISAPIPNAPNIGEVNAYAGCPHTIDVCRTRFNNKANYGGMIHIPTRNPFENRSSIF